MPIQHWSPDTCGCKFAQRHGEGNGVQFEAVVRKCSAHADVAESELYDLVIDGENRRKNQLHAELLMNDSLALGETREVVTEEGKREIRRVFRDDVEFAWAFEGTGKDRVLKFSVAGTGIDDKKLQDIQAAAEAVIGSEKLSVATAEDLLP